MIILTQIDDISSELIFTYQSLNVIKLIQLVIDLAKVTRPFQNYLKQCIEYKFHQMQQLLDEIILH